MKTTTKKLKLSRETVRNLADDELKHAGGGWIRPPITWSCPQPGSIVEPQKLG